MRVRELLSALVPAGKEAGWDPSGVQIGDADADVRTIAVCHEVNEVVAGRIERHPVDLVLTYHPLLFRPTTAFVAGPSPVGRALRLARAGVNLAVLHTAFDAAAGGTADALAETSGIVDPRPFGRLPGAEMVKVVTFLPADRVDSVAAAMSAAGAGRIGRYDGCSFRSVGTGTFLPGDQANPVVGERGALNEEQETRIEMIAPASRADRVVAAMVAAHPYEEPAYDVYATRSNESFVGRLGELAHSTSLGELAGNLEAELPSTHLRVAGDTGRAVSVVAVVPGSGGDLIGAAASAGADVIVTGDVSHHRAVEALDRGMAVIDAGHAPTERPGMRSLYAAVAALAVEASDLTDVNTDPWGS